MRRFQNPGRRRSIYVISAEAGTSPRLIALRGEVCLCLRECGLVRTVFSSRAFSVPLAMLSMFPQRNRSFAD